ncbi:MAG: ornithine carbamoyltransferase [Myxococcales bacterium]|nr:ornithine carbamoyltransferase [Myxococcales bacterium]
MADKRDFLSLDDLSEEEFRSTLTRAIELKELRANGQEHHSLRGQTLAMIFEKASTRTRVSFEIGMFELGGHAVYLAGEGSQIGRGEPISDTARVLSGYCSGIVIRTFGQDRLEELARWATVPVFNGLTDMYHPCQILADLQTILELRGSIDGLRYCWLGDGNNMAHSWIKAAAILGFDLALACPQGYKPDEAIVRLAEERMRANSRGSLTIVSDPADAVAGCAVLSTDVWASMGQEDEAVARQRAFQGYCLDQKLLEKANPGAHVLHCLPAHRGEEIATEVLEGEQSAVFQQAENRLHAQKAVLEAFLGTNR